MRKTLSAVSVGILVAYSATPVYSDGAIDFLVYASSDVGPQTAGVRVFDSTGFPVDQFETNGNPGVLLQDADSLLISLGRPGPTVVDRYDLDGNFIENVITFGGSPTIVDVHFDELGNIWAGDVQSTYYQFDASGTLLQQFSTGPSTRGKFAFSPHGTMFISARNAIHQYDLSGNLLSTTPTDFFFPGDVVIDPDGSRLYLASEPGALATFDIVAGDLQFVSSTPFNGVTPSIAIDMNWNEATGNLLVADVGSSYELTTGGDFVQAYFPIRFGHGSIAVLVPEPRGLVWATAIIAVAALRWSTSRRSNCRRGRHA